MQQKSVDPDDVVSYNWRYCEVTNFALTHDAGLFRATNVYNYDYPGGGENAGKQTGCFKSSGTFWPDGMVTVTLTNNFFTVNKLPFDFCLGPRQTVLGIKTGKSSFRARKIQIRN